MKFGKNTLTMGLCFLLLLWVSPLRAQDSLAYGMKAQELMNTGKYAEALKWLKKGITLDGQNTWLRSMRAVCFYNLGNYSQALTEYEFISKIEPSNTTADAMIAVILPLVQEKGKGPPKGKADKTIQGKRSVLTKSPDGTFIVKSASEGFQFELPSGDWKLDETVNAGVYRVRYRRHSPLPALMLQMTVRIEKAPSDKKAELKKAILFQNSLKSLHPWKNFTRKPIHGNRVYIGVFDSTYTVNGRTMKVRYRWLISWQNGRFYSFVYSHPYARDEIHYPLARHIFWSLFFFSPSK